jgi:hypothetical protein
VRDQKHGIRFKDQDEHFKVPKYKKYWMPKLKKKNNQYKYFTRSSYWIQTKTSSNSN